MGSFFDTACTDTQQTTTHLKNFPCWDYPKKGAWGLSFTSTRLICSGNRRPLRPKLGNTCTKTLQTGNKSWCSKPRENRDKLPEDTARMRLDTFLEIRKQGMEFIKSQYIHVQYVGMGTLCCCACRHLGNSTHLPMSTWLRKFHSW